MAGIGVGAHVKVGAKKGVVRFIGTTSFAVGEWYGVELAQLESEGAGLPRLDLPQQKDDADV